MQVIQSYCRAGFFREIDISSIAYDDNSLYYAGAADVAGTADINPAIAGHINLNNGLMSDKINSVNLGGYVANSVDVDGNKLYVTSGNTNGGVSILDKNNLKLQKLVAVDGAKDVAIGTSDYTVLTGAFGGSGKQSISVYNKSSNTLTKTSDLPAGISSEAKSNIGAYSNSILVSNGSAGITFWNPATSTKVDYIGLPSSLPNVDASDIYTNSVSVSDGYVYGANGAAGLVVARVNSSANGLEILGYADINGSANYVQAANGLIFVASGKGGVRIYRLEAKRITPVVPSCESRATLSSNLFGAYNNNSGSKEYFKGNASLGALNVNDTFDLCGNLLVLSTVNINAEGSLTTNGSLTVGTALNVNKNLNVEGSLTAGSITLNSGSNVQVTTAGSEVKTSGTLIMNTGSYLKVAGAVNIQGNFVFNGGTVEFIGKDASISIKGKVSGAGGTVIGTYSGKIK